MALVDTGLLRTDAYINGQWIGADDGSRFAVVNPATGEPFAEIARCGQAETARAIAAADAALPAWRALSAIERSRYLRRLFELMMEHQDDLARLLTLEQGKPLAEASGEIAYGASFLEWFAEEARRIYGDVIPSTSPDQRLLVLKQPVGVVACVTPWNFPNAMLTRKIGPALAVGCTVVCKPATATPLSALAIAELADRAGIPAGVINVVAGHTAAIGDELTGNPTVRKLTFTGSTEVGKDLIRACAGTVKRTSMELGGNAPFIVLDDADLDAAVEGAIASKFRNAGQTCVCANRILVQRSVHEAFADKLASAARALVVGNGLDEGVDIGPLIDEPAADSALEFISDAAQRGARVLTGGQKTQQGGAFLEPTVLAGATPEMRVFQEEIFGPVAPLVAFDTDDDAVALANDTEFGLASYFYSRDVGRIWRLAERIDYGIVGINTGLISNAAAPFGGMKESGSGREGSRYGCDEYLEIKYLCLAGLAG
ncbi:MAG: NAD-dependent succinate-semialdehyde dehydrogenase [Pseudomonadota bacterium]